MHRIPAPSTTKELDQGSFNIVLDPKGNEVGCAWVEPTVRTVVAPDGRTETLFVEHWFLYPDYHAPSGGAPVTLKRVSVMDKLETSYPTLDSVVTYVRNVVKERMAEVEYHRADIRARRMG